MPTQIAAMLQSLYVAYREKRLADVAAHLADDFRFTMHLPADALPGAATPHGKAETLQLFEGILAAYDILMYEPGPIMVTGDQAAVRVRIRYRHKATDAVIETTHRPFLARARRQGGAARRVPQRPARAVLPEQGRLRRLSP